MQKGLVVDLDGTLLSTNTFTQFIIQSTIVMIHTHKWGKVWLLIQVIIKRKLKQVTHEQMKFKILQITNDLFSEQEILQFAQKLSKERNNNVIKVITDYKKQGYITCLSTAAPFIYAKKIQEIFNIDLICATPSPINNLSWKENVKEEKCNNTIKLLNSNNIGLNIFITDHYDDIPLLEISKEKNILISPSKKTLNKLNTKSIKYSVLQ